MLIFMGQGNPEPKYLGNRHNLGFMAIDCIAADHGFGPWRAKFQSDVSEGWVDIAEGRVKVLLMKPRTFYNETGRAVAEAARFYKIPIDQVSVFHDEIDLAPGRLRIKRGGGHSGNRGVRSVSDHMGAQFRRVRMGVGHPGDKSQVMPYVLSDFPKAETAWRDALIEAISGALPLLAAGEDERFQTEVLRRAPAPKGDPRQTRS
ncbi:MAG: aminoacyl-tRNA hydrolase [Pseudomonadota bacterium]